MPCARCNAPLTGSEHVRMSRSRLARCAASLLLIIASLGFSLASPALAAEQHQGGAVSVFWKMQGPGNNLWNIDQLMWMEQKGYKEYWAMQFPLVGTNDAGYMGLQTVATRPDGSVGQMAIFSLWNASGSRNANGKCAPFDGEGNGLSCR